MIISPSKNFIFIHIQKCGGTSVESALEPSLRWDDMIIGSTDFGEKYQQLYVERFGVEKVRKDMLWKHSSAQDINYFLTDEGWNDFKKISVIRDPIEIVKSFYFFSQTAVKYHIGRINRNKWKEIIRTKNFPDAWPYNESYIKSYIHSAVDGSGIDGFIKTFLSEEYGEVKDQTSMLMTRTGIEFDLLIDLSMLNERWHEVCSLVNIGCVDLKRLNESEREYVELSDKSKKLIKDHYRQDYQVLPCLTKTAWN